MGTTWRIDWVPVDGDMASEWAILIRPRAGGPSWTRIGSTKGTSYELKLPGSIDDTDVAVAPIVNGSESSPEQWALVTVIPSDPLGMGAPTALDAVHVSQDVDRVRVVWVPPTDPLADVVEVRFAATENWDKAIKVAEVPASSGRADFGWWSSGAIYVGAAVRSADGRYSSAVWGAITVLGDHYYRTTGSSNESGGGFTGTKSDLSVSGGSLLLTALPVGNAETTAGEDASWRGDLLSCKDVGSYITATLDAGIVVTEKIEVAMAHTDSAFSGVPGGDQWHMAPYVHPDAQDAPGGAAARAEGWNLLSDGRDLRGQRIEVWIDTDVGGGWLGWSMWQAGCLYRFRYVRLKIVIRSLGIYSPRIDSFTWYRKRRNLKDEGTGTTTSAVGGDVVSFTTPFTATPVVTATPAAANVTVEVFSVSTTDFRVRQYNPATGALVSEPFTWHALGI